MPRSDADAQLLALYDAYGSRLHTYCLRLTAGADDAADALQETFTNVLVRLQAGERIEHPRAYLYAAARNACLRRLGEQARVDVVDAVPESEGGAPAEVEALTRDLQDEVRAANARLPARQREVLVLREVEELSYDEIGELMDLTPNGAAQLAWRARSALRGALRRDAARAITPASADCERALTLFELREDEALPALEGAWLAAHLRECSRCEASRGLVAEAGATYRLWAPAAAPLAAELVLARAKEAAAAQVAGVGVPSGEGSAPGSGGSSPPPALVAGLVAVVVAAGAFFASVGPGRGADGAPEPRSAAAAPAPAAPATAASGGAVASSGSGAAGAGAAERRREAPAAPARRGRAAKASPGRRTTTSTRRVAGRRAARRRASEGRSSRAGRSQGRAPADRPERTAVSEGSTPPRTGAPAVVLPAPVTDRSTPQAAPAPLPDPPPAPEPVAPSAPATPTEPALPADVCQGKAQGNNGQGKGGRPGC